MKIRLNPNRHRAGFAGITATGLALGIAATAGALGIGVTVAGLAGAFDPNAPNLKKVTQDQINAQLKTDKDQLGLVGAQVSDIQASVNKTEIVNYVSLGFAVLAVAAGGYLLFKKEKK